MYALAKMNDPRRDEFGRVKGKPERGSILHTERILPLSGLNYRYCQYFPHISCKKHQYHLSRSGCYVLKREVTRYRPWLPWFGFYF